MKVFERGLNFGGWISQYGDDEGRWENYLHASDFKRVRDWGFDHVRVPFDYPCVYKHGHVYLDRACQWSEENGLALVLDLHRAEGYAFGRRDNTLFQSAALQDSFVKLWTDIAEHFRGMREDDMIFELLNEITEQEPDGWNALLARTIAAIHDIDPERKIMIGGRDYNSLYRLHELPDYSTDSRVVYTFHFYLPHPFTHQRAGWDEPTRTLAQKIAYPTRDMTPYLEYMRYTHGDAAPFEHLDVLDVGWLENAMQPAVAFAKAHPNNDLYLGEFGAIEFADMDSRVHYVRDVGALCQKLGFGRAMWAYTMGFGLVDEQKREVLSRALIDAATL